MCFKIVDGDLFPGHSICLHGDIGLAVSSPDLIPSTEELTCAIYLESAATSHKTIHMVAAHFRDLVRLHLFTYVVLLKKKFFL